MRQFDTKAVKAQIDKELDGKCRVYINELSDDRGQAPFLCVATSFSRIREVLPRLHVISAENGLALYDAETRKSFFADVLDDTFISWKIREQELKKNIFAENAPIWSYKKNPFL